MFREEQVLNRADDIALRLKDEFSIVSPEWRRWTNKTNKYNTTSLVQVIGEYFAAPEERFDPDDKDNSAEDDNDYVPKAGYPGTLAPGEKFKDYYPVEDLPRKVLHPWPAAQQFQWHVRWPTTHPMIPPPLLWIALNNMYTAVGR